MFDPTSITECRLKSSPLRRLAIGANSYTVHDTAPSRKVLYSGGSENDPFRRRGHRSAPDPAPEEAISKKKAKKVKPRANGALVTPTGAKRGAKVRDHDAHVLVCGGVDCKKRGSKDVRKALKEELRERGMVGDVRVDSVGCLGLCKHGPNAIVYPRGTWYLGLTKSDVREVVGRHLGPYLESLSRPAVGDAHDRGSLHAS